MFHSTRISPNEIYASRVPCFKVIFKLILLVYLQTLVNTLKPPQTFNTNFKPLELRTILFYTSLREVGPPIYDCSWRVSSEVTMCVLPAAEMSHMLMANSCCHLSFPCFWCGHLSFGVSIIRIYNGSTPLRTAIFIKPTIVELTLTDTLFLQTFPLNLRADDPVLCLVLPRQQIMTVSLTL